MQDLTDKQALFVYNIVNGAKSGTDAARKAGYAESACRQVAFQLLDNPKVQSAIRREQFKLLGGTLASQAIGVLQAIMLDEDSPAGARVDCAKAILDRAGIVATAKPVMEQETKKISEMSSEELIEFISDAKALMQAHKDAQAIEGEAVVTVE